MDAAGALGDVARVAPRVRWVVTSRAALRIADEREYPVRPWSSRTTTGSTPFPRWDRCSCSSSGRGPSGRTSSCRRPTPRPSPRSAATSTGCRWRWSWPPRGSACCSAEALHARLDDRLRILTGGLRDAPERQRTLRATIEWSHDLLAEHDRTLLARLAVFEGGWTYDAAEQVVRRRRHRRVRRPLVAGREQPGAPRRDRARRLAVQHAGDDPVVRARARGGRSGGAPRPARPVLPGAGVGGEARLAGRGVPAGEPPAAGRRQLPRGDRPVRRARRARDRRRDDRRAGVALADDDGVRPGRPAGRPAAAAPGGADAGIAGHAAADGERVRARPRPRPRGAGRLHRGHRAAVPTRASRRPRRTRRSPPGGCTWRPAIRPPRAAGSSGRWRWPIRSARRWSRSRWSSALRRSRRSRATTRPRASMSTPGCAARRS